jgi:hypothetical protein
VDSLVRKIKKVRAKENKATYKRRDTKGCFHTTQEQQNDVETKRGSSKVHHHTTMNKQNGVETKESVVIHVHFSGHVSEHKYNIKDSASAHTTNVAFHREYFRYRYLYFTTGK